MRVRVFSVPSVRWSTRLERHVRRLDRSGPHGPKTHQTPAGGGGAAGIGARGESPPGKNDSSIEKMYASMAASISTTIVHTRQSL